MKFAVIGDVHSNIFALESVLADIEGKDMDFILCTGDLVGYAPFPNEVIDALKKAHVLSVQGNYDEAIGNRKLICGCDYRDEKQLEMASLSVRFTNETIHSDNRDYLQELPRELTLKGGGSSIRVVHGSPRRNNEYLFEDSVEVQEVVKELEEDVLICGHTHIPYIQVIDGRYIINAGSVGKPKHGSPHATYMAVTVAGKQIDAFIQEVPYDVEKTAKAIEDNPMLPNEFAEMLRKG